MKRPREGEGRPECGVFSGFVYFCLLFLPQVCVQLNIYVCIWKVAHLMGLHMGVSPSPFPGPGTDVLVCPYMCTPSAVHGKWVGPLQIITESLDHSQLTCDHRRPETLGYRAHMPTDPDLEGFSSLALTAACRRRQSQERAATQTL